MKRKNKSVERKKTSSIHYWKRTLEGKGLGGEIINRAQLNNKKKKHSRYTVFILGSWERKATISIEKKDLPKEFI